MTSSDKVRPRRLTTVVVFLLLVAVPLAALAIALAIQGPDVYSEVDRMHVGLRFVVSAILAVLGCIATVGSYLLVFFTACFTFRFDRPVYAGFKRRLYVANILVPLIASLAAVGMVDMSAALAAAVFAGAAAPSWLVTVVPTIILVNLSATVFSIWAPVETRLIAKRLAAQGVSPQLLRTGVNLGISDPARSDWAKIVLEDDVGMLWIEPGRLTYRGDVTELSLAPTDVSEIERVVVSASLASHVGVRHIVIHLHQDRRRVRLHVEGHITLPGQRRATDLLADRLVAWKTAAAPAPTAASA